MGSLIHGAALVLIGHGHPGGLCVLLGDDPVCGDVLLDLVLLLLADDGEAGEVLPQRVDDARLDGGKSQFDGVLVGKL